MNDLLGEVKSQEDIVSEELASVQVSPKVPASKPVTPEPTFATPSTATPSTAPEKKHRFGFLRRKKNNSADSLPTPGSGAGAAATSSTAEEMEEDELEAEPEPEPAMSNQQFMAEVSRVKKLLDAIHEKRGEVELINDKVKSMTKTADIQMAQQKCEREMVLIKKYAGESKSTIQRLQEEDQAEELDVTSGTERMRHTITAGLVTRLKRELEAFREFEARVTADYREVVERRLRVVSGQEVDEEQVERMIDSGEAETVFRKAMQQQSSTAVVDLLNQTEERYNGMKKLNTDLVNLNQMMLDFATLVEEQGMMIDNIEAQVATAADYIRDGTDHVLAAKGHKKTKEKYKAAATGVAAGAAAATAAVGATVIAAPLAL